MKILLPVDGSELALEAVRFAIRLAQEGLQASFVLANVQEPTHLYEMVLARDTALVERAADAAGVHALDGARDLLGAAGFGAELEVATGDPAHTLVDIVERHACEMVIMAARDPGAVRSLLGDSVSESLLHDCPVPVMIVRPAEDGVR